MAQKYHELPFQLEHVIAKKHHGADDPANRARSCFNCNVHKGSNIAGIDPKTQLLTRLFNPRIDQWDEHFDWIGAELLGKTDVGRTTVDVLGINLEENLDLRRLVLLLGEKLT